MPDLFIRPEEPVKQVIRYSTEILEAIDGSEQRIAKLLAPRQLLSYSYLFTSMADVRNFRTMLYKNLYANWRVPLWWEPEITTAGTTAPGNTFEFPVGQCDFDDGDSIYVEIPGGGAYQVFTIASMTPSGCTTVENASIDFPAGSGLYRLKEVQITQPPSFRRWAVGPESVSLELEYVDLALPGGQGAAGLSTYQSSIDAAPLQLLDKRPTANNPISYSAHFEREVVEYDKNYTAFSGIDDSPFIEQRLYTFRGRSELQWWKSFISQIVGAREPFYIPTYRSDLLHLSGPVGAPWTDFDVADEADDPSDAFDYAGQWWTKAAYKNLRIRADGADYYREVTSAVDNADSTVSLSLLTGLPASPTISEISFLTKARASSDYFSFTHYNDFSTIEFSTKVIHA